MEQHTIETPKAKDARLRATIAQLLAALEAALDVMDNMTTDDWERGKDRPVRDMARDAIKEAKK